MDYVQMHHPKLDNRVITIAEVGVPVHEQAGWILGATPDTAPTTPQPAPVTPTTSGTATVPGSDGGTPATTDTGAPSGSDTTEEKGTPA